MAKVSILPQIKSCYNAETKATRSAAPPPGGFQLPPDDSSPGGRFNIQLNMSGIPQRACWSPLDSWKISLSDYRCCCDGTAVAGSATALLAVVAVP